MQAETRASNPKIEAAAAIARAQASLEEAVAELDRLPALDAQSIGLSAHALSNFLTVSSVVVDFLLTALHSHPDRQVRVWLEGLSHATNLMAHTVGQLMNSSEDVPSKLQVDIVDLPVLVERACAYYRGRAQRKDIELIFSAESDLPSVRTDRVLVSAVVDNLLSNAAKYSPRGRRIWVQVAAEPGGIVCRVRDEGPGLSPDEQARLFLPGVRLGPVPTDGEPSSGYGLAIAKRFVDQLGGKIQCVAAPGEGATFSFSLPVRAAGD
jgi:signal transduction histidine kinase